MQILKPRPKPVESETLGIEPISLVFYLLQMFLMHTKLQEQLQKANEGNSSR